MYSTLAQALLRLVMQQAQRKAARFAARRARRGIRSVSLGKKRKSRIRRKATSLKHVADKAKNFIETSIRRGETGTKDLSSFWRLYKSDNRVAIDSGELLNMLTVKRVAKDKYKVYFINRRLSGGLTSFQLLRIFERGKRIKVTSRMKKK